MEDLSRYRVEPTLKKDRFKERKIETCDVVGPIWPNAEVVIQFSSSTESRKPSSI